MALRDEFKYAAGQAVGAMPVIGQAMRIGAGIGERINATPLPPRASDESATNEGMANFNNGVYDTRPGDAYNRGRGVVAAPPPVLGTPLLTNQGEGGARVEYPNDYTRQVYSAPDTKAVATNYRNAPTAARFGDRYLSPSGVAYGSAPTPQPQAEPTRPRSSFEDIALNAARNATERLAVAQEYRQVRTPSGQLVQVKVPRATQEVDPNRIYSDTLATLRHGEPSGGDVLQAQTTREGYAANERRYGQQERGEMTRAELAARTSMYGADRQAEAASGRNEIASKAQEAKESAFEEKLRLKAFDRFLESYSGAGDPVSEFMGQYKQATQGGTQPSMEVRRDPRSGKYFTKGQDGSLIEVDQYGRPVGR